MQIKDARNVAWTASSPQSGERLMEAMRLYFTFRSDAMAHVDDLVKADPQCPMAWVLRGYLLLFSRSADLVSDARTALGQAQALADQSTAGANSGERLHIAALKAWVEADTLGAQAIWSAILETTPHDLLALRVQHFNALFLGRPGYLADLSARTMMAWSDDVPGAGFAWSTACMGLEEIGAFASAESLGRRGAELEPEDLWAVHSVAHVMEAQGRLDDGLQWMERPPAFWENRGSMRHHLWWHEALFLYEAGEYDKTLAYYDARIAPHEPIGYLEMSNAASMLLRLEAAGLSCGERWDQLAQSTMHWIGSRGLTFGDVHMLITFGMAGDGSSLRTLTQSIAGYAETGRHFDQVASANIAVPLAKAFAAHTRADFACATDILLGARRDFIHMGGSNAQRDALDILLVDCAVAAKKHELARGLMEDYLSVRPLSVPMRQRLDRLNQPHGEA